ncbi:YihY/virulence factor BrkB family protein [Leucobacter denitrificans]|uniref:YihY/virulence factor BrkB family protein n=1 Tax=Leucobacter denitrificans TaxID=683042 RepID=A0A7G9S3H7_9MICO|nr:YhjD/YihY/BrkB family envelope integrity protein [Leucobacter denitrificans]QNN62402.1 YihY/virulence factor BrkB family protein [Leucobacter denitrificans]
MSERPLPAVVTKWRRLWHWFRRQRPYRTFSHFTNVGGNVLSGGMSYQALFAVFAGLLVGFGVFGIFLREHETLLDVIVDQINTSIPGLLGDDGAVSVQELLATRAIDWTSIVAAVSLLWIAVNWFTGTRRSIRIIFGLEVKEYRNAVYLKIRDFVLALCFALAIVISAALTVASSNIADTVLGWLGANPDNWFFGTLGTVVRYGALYVFDVLILMAIHWALAEVRIGWWNLLIGCLLGAAALFGLKFLGAALLGGASSNPLLATFAIFVGLLLWFNFVCRVLLLTSAWIATGLDKSLGLPEDPARRSASAFF